ncbi:prephenate dehydrogenase [Verrucomicrobiota bacterium sgz303538]
MTKLAVIGPGLLGGSLALAARRAGGFRVSLWARRREAVGELRSLNIADHASGDLLAVADGADLVIFCVPIGVMPDLARKIVPQLKPDTLVTDVGSVKAPVVEQLGAIFRGRARFVGSHPMAGSEQTGVRAARADLFDDAVCIVTPDANSESTAVHAISAFWRTVGCRVREISPEAHDEAVAAVSHLPHLAAAALVNAIADGHGDAFEFVGPGFRDTTRVASGPPDMWTEILKSNRRAVRKTTEAMIAKLEQFITLLDRDSPESETLMNEFLTKAKAQRDSLRLVRDSRLPN